MTGGRTASTNPDLELEALVFTDPATFTGRRLSHRRLAVALLCQDALSVAEISAHLWIPLGAARVLVGDMVAEGLVHLHRAPGVADGPDRALLQRVLEGLRTI
jgi:hypothetical protein